MKTDVKDLKAGTKIESVYRILNLYACLGGNRYKWDEVAKEK